MSTPPAPDIAGWLARLFNVRDHEAPVVGAGLAMFFLLFSG